MDTEDAPDILGRTLEALDNKTASADIIEAGIASSVALVRQHARNAYTAEQSHKNRFQKHKTAASAPVDRIYANHCGNMACYIQMVLEHPDLQITHHQMHGADGLSMNHHFLSISWKGHNWVVDPSVEQFMGNKNVSPALRAFTENGFFDIDQENVGQEWHRFYHEVDGTPAQGAPQNLLEQSVLNNQKIDLGEVEDSFVFDARKLRRKIGTPVY